MTEEGPRGPATVADILGQIAWLLSVSPRHRTLQFADLEWLVMPPVLNKQFHLFWEGKRPVGVALWAFLDEAREAKAEAALADQQALVRFEAEDWASGDRLWLVELVAPFATPENRQAELMVADLIAGQFSDRAFKMINVDPVTFARTCVRVDETARANLLASVRAQLAERERTL